MSKRFYQTILAIGSLWAGMAQAQLVIQNDQKLPPPPSSKATQAPAKKPSSGLFIVNGYDETPAPSASAKSPHPALNVLVKNLNPPAGKSVAHHAPVQPDSKMAKATPHKAVSHPASPAAAASVAKLASTPAKHKSSVAASGSLVEVGERPKHVGEVQGWADSMPLGLALKQIVPGDYIVHEDGVSKQQKLSWSGGRSWPDVLATLARNAHAHAAIIWKDKVVTLVPNTKPALVTWKAPQHKLEPAPQLAKVVHKPVKKEQVFHLDPNKTLRQNVEVWAHEAGWNRVIWEGADYPIYAPATFTGNFASPHGPLAQLIEAYANSKRPLVVRLTTMDKVVHVFSKDYQPVEVKPASPFDLAPQVLQQDGVGASSFQDIKPSYSTHGSSSSATSSPSSASQDLKPIHITDSTVRGN